MTVQKQNDQKHEIKTGDVYNTPLSSTSNTSVAFGGIVGGDPFWPYLYTKSKHL